MLLQISKTHVQKYAHQNANNVFAGRVDLKDYKRLMYQSNHRGCKEMDILLGGFASQTLNQLSEDELKDYSNLLEVDDAQIYDWLIGKSPPPEDFNTKVLAKIIEFCEKRRII